MKLGIITAQYEEVEWLVERIEHKDVSEICGRVFYSFESAGNEIVAVFSRWGKVAAAVTASVLIEHFHPDFVVSVGLGSAVVPELNIGDVVVAQHLFQHDMDMRPLFRRYEVPLSGVTSYAVQENDQHLAADAVHNLLKQSKELRRQLLDYGIAAPKLLLGDVASGDLLITGASRKAAINRNLPSVLCADMESAALAQVCADFSVACVVLRIVSDVVDETANNQQAEQFKNDFSAKYNVAIVQSLIEIIESSNQ